MLVYHNESLPLLFLALTKQGV